MMKDEAGLFSELGFVLGAGEVVECGMDKAGDAVL